jgi:DNA-directed RNA polymerase specialized sigma24 family protein
MTDTPDADLLEQYARENSGAAFTMLVERHIGLVHSVALRHTANSQHAQDITQAVFIILARKARNIAPQDGFARLALSYRAADGGKFSTRGNQPHPP